MKLTVVSSLEYYRTPQGFAGAWPAAVREIDALASLFDRVVHVACLHPGEPPTQSTLHTASNVGFEWLPPAGGKGLKGKLDALRAMPGRVSRIERAWRGADAVLVRCPSNSAVAALGLMALRRGPSRRWVKYTGAWQGRRGEKLSYKLQRWWLRCGVTGARVSIGGLDDGPGAVAVCNPSLSLEEAWAAELATRGKSVAKPWRLLVAGRLVPDKGAEVALHVLAGLRRQGFEVALDIAGDGVQRASLEAQARKLAVSERVRFHGWLTGPQVAALYSDAHVLLAPCRGEGWSRAWTDAAAHRCVPVVSAVGSARGLEKRRAGLVLDSLEPAVWAARLARLLSSESAWRNLAERGPGVARELTYERFLEGARRMLELDGASEAQLCEEVS